MRIKIKRCTMHGLVEREGEYFEAGGRQFCLTKDDDGYDVVDLFTGCGVSGLCYHNVSEERMIELAKEKINKKTLGEWEKGDKKVKEIYCKEYNFTLPVNKVSKHG